MASSVQQSLKKIHLLIQENSLAKAKVSCLKLSQKNKTDFDAWALLAHINFRLHREDEYLENLRTCLSLRSTDPQVLSELGRILERRQLYDEAIPVFEALARLHRHDATYLYDLSIMLMHTGQYEEASGKLLSVTKKLPLHTQAHASLGLCLKRLNRNDEAIDSYRRAVSCDPKNPGYRCELALLMLLENDLYIEAAELYLDVLDHNPEYLDAYTGLAYAFYKQGMIRKSIESYRKLLQHDSSDFKAHSNLLFFSNYQSDQDKTKLYEEHRNWAQQHSKNIPPRVQHSNSRDLDRVLKVGYVSADYEQHSVAYFIEPLLEHHDPAQIEVNCYSSTEPGDDMTERLKSKSKHWNDVANLHDDAVSAMIIKDKIDILVDLSGHTAKHRLLVFARKPAPVQISYLGYPNTTGLSTIDYRFTDSVADPKESNDSLYSENLWHLPNGFLCYRAPERSPEPHRRSDQTVFGSFNSLAKITPNAIKVWSLILQKTPGSKLILKNQSFVNQATQEHYRSMFYEHGISNERLMLYGWKSSISSHLELYNQIDIALDTFPYNGTTTTCEALWMGVPVISLQGDRHVSRVGMSLLHQIGQQDLVATSESDYINLASTLASDQSRLEWFKSELRTVMQASTLCDSTGFTHCIESAYRSMWHKWCKSTNFY